MESHKKIFLLAGILSFSAALLHALIGFSPKLSLYFGAPEALVENIYLLIIACLLISVILILFGIYALSGAGYILKLPWLKQMLAVISSIYIFKGLLFIPELMVVLGLMNTSIPVAPRFVVFSLVSLLIGLFYLLGTMKAWNQLSLRK